MLTYISNSAHYKLPLLVELHVKVAHILYPHSHASILQPYSFVTSIE